MCLHLSARVPEEACLSVCRPAQRIVSQSASLVLSGLGWWWVWPLRGAEGALVLLLQGRLIAVMW